MAETKPIFTGDFPQDSFDIIGRDAPALRELAARLRGLPPGALKAAVLAQPENGKAMIAAAQDTAAYLRLIADSFSELARQMGGA